MLNYVHFDNYLFNSIQPMANEGIHDILFQYFHLLYITIFGALLEKLEIEM